MYEFQARLEHNYFFSQGGKNCKAWTIDWGYTAAPILMSFDAEFTTNSRLKNLQPHSFLVKSRRA